MQELIQKTITKTKQKVKACLRCLEALMIYTNEDMRIPTNEFNMLHIGHPLTILDKEIYLLLVEEKFLVEFIKELNYRDTPITLRKYNRDLCELRVKINRYKKKF